MRRKKLIVVANRGPVTLKSQHRPLTVEEFEKELEQETQDLTKEQRVVLVECYKKQYADEIELLIALESKQIATLAEYNIALTPLKRKGGYLLDSYANLTDTQRNLVFKIVTQEKELRVYVPMHSAGGESGLAAELEASGAKEEGVHSACWICWPGIDFVGTRNPDSSEVVSIAEAVSKVMSTEEMAVSAVLLSRTEQHDHYDIISNSMLWLLMHAVRTDVSSTCDSTQRHVYDKALDSKSLTEREKDLLSILIDNPPLNIAISILNKTVVEGVRTLLPLEQKMLDSILSNPTLLFSIEKSKFVSKKFDLEAGVSVEYTPDYDLAWDRYKKVNERFAKHIVKEVVAAESKGEIAIIWIHDFPLLTTAAGIRRERPDLVVKYYHHPPFPKPENFLLMPYSEEIIEAWLQADEIRFQVIDYVNNFLDTVHYLIEKGKLAGWDVQSKKIITPNGRVIFVHNSPIGVNYDVFAVFSKEDKQVSAMVANIRESAAANLLSLSLTPKIIFAGGRADYIKGFIELLLAYKSLLLELENYSDELKIIKGDTRAEIELYERNNVIRSIQLILKVLPEDQSIFAYNAVWQRVNQLIDEIKILQIKLNLLPMTLYTHRFSTEGVITLNREADVVVVPIRSRDGFNRMAPEAIASWEGRSNADLRQQGVMILGSGAGVHEYLRNYVITVESDASEEEFIYQLKEALLASVTKPLSEQREWTVSAQKIIREELPITAWVQQCVGLKLTSPLVKVIPSQEHDIIRRIYGRGSYFLQAEHYQKAIERFSQAYERICALGLAVSEDTAEILYSLGEVYERNNQPQQADKHFKLAFTIRKAIFSDQHQMIAEDQKYIKKATYREYGEHFAEMPVGLQEVLIASSATRSTSMLSFTMITSVIESLRYFHQQSSNQFVNLLRQVHEYILISSPQIASYSQKSAETILDITHTGLELSTVLFEMFAQIWPQNACLFTTPLWCYVLAGAFAFRQKIEEKALSLIGRRWLINELHRARDSDEYQIIQIMMEVGIRCVVPPAVTVIHDFTEGARYGVKKSRRQVQYNYSPLRQTWNAIKSGLLEGISNLKITYLGGPLIESIKSFKKEITNGYQESGILGALDKGSDALTNFIPGGAIILRSLEEQENSIRQNVVRRERAISRQFYVEDRVNWQKSLIKHKYIREEIVDNPMPTSSILGSPVSLFQRRNIPMKVRGSQVVANTVTEILVAPK